MKSKVQQKEATKNQKNELDEYINGLNQIQKNSSIQLVNVIRIIAIALCSLAWMDFLKKPNIFITISLILSIAYFTLEIIHYLASTLKSRSSYLELCKLRKTFHEINPNKLINDYEEGMISLNKLTLALIITRLIIILAIVILLIIYFSKSL